MSDENESIYDELHQVVKERNYLEHQLEIMRQEYLVNFRNQKELWNEEQMRLEEKIANLESIVLKLSMKRDCNSCRRWDNNSFVSDHEMGINDSWTRIASSNLESETPKPYV